MDKKIFKSQLKLKGDEDAEVGSFTAVFATLNVIDHQGDVTVPGAFKEGQEVRISYWGHRWQDLPVGKGTIHSDDTMAWLDGKFFLDTEAGNETYKTVKNLGGLQEWSYGFDIEEADLGKFKGEDVTFLRMLEVYEVSPVMLGAGIDTHTLTIKGKGEEEEISTDLPGELITAEIPSVDPECEAGDGKQSGVTPEVVQTLIQLENMED